MATQPKTSTIPYTPITTFKSRFPGWIPASRYEVEYNGYFFDPEQVTLPSKTFSLFSDNLYGPVRQYPYREIYNDNIVITVPEVAQDNDFRRWFEYVANQACHTGIANPGNIDTNNANMFIYILDQGDVPLHTFEIYGAYPISIVPTNMGFGMMNETLKTQIMFKYYRYEYKVT
tara:strand:+ start:133 stop:654 length:522 start_codon:yes stop_codon:yes gene_type:complete